MADHRDSVLRPGTPAPEFELRATPDQSLELSDFRGHPLIMAFYPADWSPVCTDQMALYNEILPEFQRFGAHLVGISVDSAWCHVAFAQSRNLHFPLLADFHPKGEVAQRYGVYDDNVGMSERALFVVDGEGVIHWAGSTLRTCSCTPSCSASTWPASRPTSSRASTLRACARTS